MNRRFFLRSALATGSTSLAAPFLSALALQSEGSVIRLNGNENALGPAPAARAAIEKAIFSSNRYPIVEASELTRQIADYHGVAEDSVLLGNGSSEILRLAVQVLAKRDRVAVTAQPTYEAVGRHAAALGIPVKQIPLRSDYSHDLREMRETAESHPGESLIYLCNPNNPTATLTASEPIQDWIESAPERTAFIVDEAYFDFVEDPRYASAIPLAIRKKNLLVARTFSKVYALAGLRIGYGVAHPDLINRLSSLTRLNANALAIAAASASLSDSHFIRDSLRSNRESKEMVLNTLKELEISFLPSHTNFVMHRLTGSIRDYIERMRSHGVLVGRPFPPLENYCRVSLGLPNEMEKYSALLKQFRSKGWI